MTNRKKRLEKGIESLGKQIKIHKEKLETARKNNMLELANYYEKEIEAKEKDKEKKMKLLNK
ncbi:hypothetical protein HYT57_04505 [Candidatus Woesearchaeota archaeon]|nr:hypothetical protein [Candidatus Woesearchaeota archaeon]